MEKDYIKIYEDAYSKYGISHEDYIRKKVIAFHDYLPFNKSNSLLISDLNSKEEDLIIFEEPWRKITTIFRTTRFRPGHQLRKIQILLLPEFSKIKVGDLNITFEHYIEELAKFKAYEEINRIYSNNDTLYSLMYDLNDFSEFKIIGCEGEVYQELLEKHYKIKSGAADISLQKTNQQEDITKNKFVLKNFCPELESNKKEIESKIFYNFLVLNYFIDTDFTSFIDFKNVFLEDFETNNSIFRFECSTQKGVILLVEIKERLSKKLNFTNIEISKKFKTKYNKYLRRKNITESNRKAKAELKIEVKTLLDSYFN